jgi:uncharacterized alkaline shock family protein YloU
MNDYEESIGRIEVAPEVLLTIVRQEVLSVEGVNRMAPIPAEVSHLFRRASRQEGVVLDYSDNHLAFDVYVYMEPDVNLRETSRAIQVAVIEAIDKMVGVPVEATWKMSFTRRDKPLNIGGRTVGGWAAGRAEA